MRNPGSSLLSFSGQSLRFFPIKSLPQEAPKHHLRSCIWKFIHRKLDLHLLHFWDVHRTGIQQWKAASPPWPPAPTPEGAGVGGVGRRLPLRKGFELQLMNRCWKPRSFITIMELKLHIKKLIPVANIGVRMLLASWQSHSTTEVLSCSVSTLFLSQVSTFHQNLLLEVGTALTGITALWAKGVTALHQDFLQEKSSEKRHIRLLSPTGRF